jgi:hypothetical protein
MMIMLCFFMLLSMFRMVCLLLFIYDDYASLSMFRMVSLWLPIPSCTYSMFGTCLCHHWFVCCVCTYSCHAIILLFNQCLSEYGISKKYRNTNIYRLYILYAKFQGEQIIINMVFLTSSKRGRLKTLASFWWC